MSIPIEEIEDLPIGSVVVTLGSSFVKVSDNVWMTPLHTGDTRSVNTGHLASIAVKVVFDATFQQQHLGDFFVPEFDQI